MPLQLLLLLLLLTLLLLLLLPLMMMKLLLLLLLLTLLLLILLPLMMMKLLLLLNLLLLLLLLLLGAISSSTGIQLNSRRIHPLQNGQRRSVPWQPRAQVGRKWRGGQRQPAVPSRHCLYPFLALGIPPDEPLAAAHLGWGGSTCMGV